MTATIWPTSTGAALPKRRIAASFLPSRYHYWYSLSKLAMDPVYTAVRRVFADDREPLLDVGCGIGLLLHCLRANGSNTPYLGIDSDPSKIDVASTACVRSGLDGAHFLHCDLTLGLPEHAGSVALLDVLQYLEPHAQAELIAGAARSITPEGRLVIRGGLNDGSWRAAVTRAADRFGHAIRWMEMPFKSQLRPAELASMLGRHGLEFRFRPLWGRTPFNNWLIVARPGRREPRASTAAGTDRLSGN